jgi:hypothetical protein
MILLAGGTGVDVGAGDSAYLDCINDNIAVLLDFYGVGDVRTPFACHWRFDFADGAPDDQPALESLPVPELVERLTGWRLASLAGGEAPWSPVLDGTPVLAFGDSFEMSWLPYVGRRHIVHSFIIDGVDRDRGIVRVADAYENRTEWGEVSPQTLELPFDELERVLAAEVRWRGSTLHVLERVPSSTPVDPDRVLQEGAEQMRGAAAPGGAIDVFTDHYEASRDDLEAARHFTLACWSATRARALLALWLGERAASRPSLEPLAEELATIGAAWKRVSEFAYIAERRASLGREAPRAAFELLRTQVRPSELAAAEQALSVLTA